MTIITIDGNIGCGKTSILNYLHRTYKLPIDIEPIDSWNNNLIQFYENNKDVFNFQLRIWLDRCWVQEKSDSTVFMERSPYFIKNTFIELAYKDKLLSDEEYNILIDLHRKTDNIWDKNIYIYLQSNPENCFKQIKRRNRSYEKYITQEYINKLHNYHEENYNTALKKNMNIILINVEGKSISKIAEEIIESVK